MPVENYVRNAKVVTIVDGDTLDIDIDLGFRLSFRQRVRVLGINCPEMHGPSKLDGIAARIATINFVAQTNGVIVVKTHLDKLDSFGRVLAEIWVNDKSLAEALLAGGFAIPFRG